MNENYELALIDYNTAVRIKPDLEDAYYNRGILYIKEKKYELAIKDFEYVIRLKPDYAECYYNKAIAEYNSGNKDAGCLDWQKALSLGNQDAAKAINNNCR